MIEICGKKVVTYSPIHWISIGTKCSRQKLIMKKVQSQGQTLLEITIEVENIEDH